MDYTNILSVLDLIRNTVPSKDDTTLQKITKGILFGCKASSEYSNYRNSKKINSYKMIDSNILKSVFFDPKISSLLKTKDEFTKNHRDFIVKSLDNCGEMIFIENMKAKKEMSKIYNFWVDKKFNYKNLGELMYEAYSNKIMLSGFYAKATEHDYGSYHEVEYKFKSCQSKDKILNNRYILEANRLLENPGTYLFYGPPGTGKSTFIFSDKHARSKCIRLDAQDFFRLDDDQLFTMIEIFNPDILLVEELDKYQARVGELLLKLESIRKHNMRVIITANEIKDMNSAMLRPQRIDHILHFDLPNEQETLELIDFYCASDNDEEITKLKSLLTENKFSHAYIVDLSKKLDNNYNDILNYVNFLVKISKKEEKK